MTEAKTPKADYVERQAETFHRDALIQLFVNHGACAWIIEALRQWKGEGE